MTRTKRSQAVERAAEAYEQPALITHGTVQDLTAGLGGDIPDTAPQGSFFLDGQEP